MAASRIDAKKLNTLMPQTDWKKVKDLFHEALRRDSSQRSAFLKEACDGDTSLRSEVESLLASLNDAKTFLETPVIRESFGGPKADWYLENGYQLSHYKIVKPIGSGGMGEVYLADDQRLGRRVALKVLPNDMRNDKNRLSRFEREANAVSALNHPNILTIFEFEQNSEIPFFASEFVSGVTLRERLKHSELSILETLDITIQIASALQAAHEAGVVHRDIKPENVMIREDGYVKILDFGLAKLTENLKPEELEKTLSQRFSHPGMIMGTMTYMSPEQARGVLVDGRSDIFSLGILIFEMLAGRPPFSGETATDVLAEIVQSDPPKLSTINPKVPVEFDEIVDRALAKTPADRFQNAKELIAELKALLKRLEFNAELERSGTNLSNSAAGIREPMGSILNVLSNTDSSGDLSPLVGRTTEIAQLTDLFGKRAARLVTLTGIGGTGKTRLAQEICSRLKSEFGDGFVFVRLADVLDISMVPAVIAQHARVQEVIGKPILESLKEFLADKEILLVLDNFEQIMDAAPLVAELLNSADRLRILVTSRERLHLQAEIEFSVPTLTVPEEDQSNSVKDLAKFDSVRLFVERAQKANSDFKLTDENAEQIAKICSMLDGLPLAIELAAARTRIFSPATILEKLVARLTFLTGGARDLPKRQQTMRAAVDWSYDLLNDDERLLFRRLSVFACHFTLDAAEQVAWLDEEEQSVHPAEFLDVFASLADKSLLVRRKDRRGEMTYCLLEIVREYAQSVLVRDDNADVVRRKHSMFYLALAEKAEPHLRAEESAKWINLLEEDHDNLASAISWSIQKEPQIAARLTAAIRHFWLTRGYFSEGLRWAETALEKNVQLPADIEWKILMTCGNISQFRGDREKAEEYYERALAAARLSGDRAFIAQSLRGLTAMAYIKMDIERARRLVTEAISISETSRDDFGLAASLARLGDISSIEGDFEKAREYTSEALAIFRRLGYLEGISAKLYNLGAIVFLAGEFELARQHFLEAFEVAIDLGEKINTRLIFDGFAALATNDEDFALAARLSGVADSLGTTIGYAIEPAEKIFRDAYFQKLKGGLTAEAYEAEHQAGQKLSTSEARKLVASL